MNPNSLLINQLTLLDGLVFFVCYGLTLLAVFLGKKWLPIRDIVHYTVVGRQLTLPLFVATLVSTWYGGIFGVTEYAFETGLYSLLTQGLFWYAIYFVFAFFLAQKIRRTEALSMPAMLEKKIGRGGSYFLAGANILNVLPFSYIISIGLLVSAMTSLTLVPATLIGTALCLVYSYSGGLRSVVFSDAMQFLWMFLAVGAVVAFSYGQYGGYSFLEARLPESFFYPWQEMDWQITIMWGLIACTTLVDPNFYQRCFAARTPGVARMGILISVGFWFCFDLCTHFGAMYARAVYPDIEAEGSYLFYAFSVLPAGWKGLFLAGILATILSTLDSYLFLATHTVNYDLFRRRTSIVSHKMIYVVVVVVSIVGSFYFDGSVKDVWKTMGSLSAGTILVPVTVLLFRDLPKSYFSVSVGSSLVAMLAWILWGSEELLFIYVGLMASLIIAFIYYLFRAWTAESPSGP